MADATKQLREKKCPMCGKRYIFHDYWAYKIVSGTRVESYCSWSCMRKAEREKGYQKKRKKAV